MVKKHILVAEDDISISEVMTIILEEEGYELTTATSSEEIASSIKQHKPDLIFLDVRLGGESGEKIAMDLKAQPTTKKVPLIIVSADEKISDIAANAQADAYLSKPFDIETLTSLVRTYLP